MGRIKIMRKSFLFSIAIILASITPAFAETRLVPSEYVTIQYAINLANNGDTIIVDPGVYLENLNFLGKSITVTSTDPENPDIVAATIIDGYRAGSVVIFKSGEGPEAVLSGFTITGGVGTYDVTFGEGNNILWGPGIYCTNSSPTIKNNLIKGNTGLQMVDPQNPDTWRLGYGGGIGCFNSNAVIYRNVIKNNEAFAGAGVMTYLGNPIINSNLIYNNSAYIGGGLVLLASGNVINNTIVGNDANLEIEGGTGIAGNIYALSDPDFGGGQYLIANNIICDAKTGYGVLMSGSGGGLIISNNVWNNSPSNYVEEDSQTGNIGQGRGTDKTGRNGNISQNPLFVDPNNNDYHLQFDSPCIGAGNSSYVPEPNATMDIDNEPRIYAGSVDIGADEYVGYIKPIAYAGPNQYISTSELVTLDGSGSYFYDPNGIMIFRWIQVDGPAVTLSDPNSAQPTFMPEQEGEYRFELIVNDGIYDSEPDDVSIFVQNLEPVVDAGQDLLMASPSSIVTFDSRDFCVHHQGLLTYYRDHLIDLVDSHNL